VGKSTLGKAKMRLLIVQYAGDYREAVQRFDAGEPETYYAQKYSVDTIAEIAQKTEETTVLCCFTAKPYDEILSNGVRAIGAGFQDKFDIPRLIELIAEQNPTHLIVRTATRQLFKWAIQNKISTLAMFAESINTQGGWRTQWRNYWLARYLNHEQIQWVGSYGISASKSLQKIGVKPEKIIPWNFIVTETPEAYQPKSLRVDPKTWEIFYIGSMIEAKGVGDILDAVAALRTNQFPIKLKLAGNDATGTFHQKAKALNIADCVEFMGIIPNKTVIPLMRTVDLVIVPSRHEYPEGFPLAITHALCAQTPIIASDHPMFINHLKSGNNAMIFPAGNSTALASCIEKILTHSELYTQISSASYTTWKKLQMPVKWDNLIRFWLNNTGSDQQWLYQYRLSSGIYTQNESAVTEQQKHLAVSS
jgi:glycosyltransferase involved in cell wall biosynthesis